MKNRMKKLVAMALGTAMLLSANATPVYGADHSHDPIKITVDSEPGNINGFVTSASIAVEDNYRATASTGFNGYGATCNVTAKVYYCLGEIDYYSQISSSTSQPGGTTAIATKKLGGADVIGGKGIHKVTYGNYTWSPTTSVGETPSSAKLK